jgi:hypothetical protein
MWPQLLMLELITFWCQKQTHKRQKILTRQFSLDQEGASLCSLLLSKHAGTKWLTVALPYMMQSYLPLTWDLSRSNIHNLSFLPKRVTNTLIEKNHFSYNFPPCNLNSFLQTYLGVIGSHVSGFLIETSYFGRVGVNVW